MAEKEERDLNMWYFFGGFFLTLAILVTIEENKKTVASWDY